MSKREIIDRSAAICRDLNDAATPHVRRLNRAGGPRGVVRHGRRFSKVSRPYLRGPEQVQELTYNP